MHPLSPEAQARLAAFRGAESPDDAIAARCLAALERRIAEPPAPPRRRIAVIAAVAVALAAGLVIVARWAVTGGGAGGEGVAAPYHHSGSEAPGAALSRESSGSRAPARAAVDVAAEAAGDSQESALPAGESQESGGEAPREPAVREPRAGKSSEGKRPRASADDLAAEVALLREAKLAAPGRRIELLEEASRRFPGGAFAAERGLLEIEARCALGEVEEARALARRFAQRFPGSSLAPRAARVCVADETETTRAGHGSDGG